MPGCVVSATQPTGGIETYWGVGRQVNRVRHLEKYAARALKLFVLVSWMIGEALANRAADSS